MGAIAFSPRTEHTEGASNWLSAVQAVFAFFAPSNNSAHAWPNPAKQEAAAGQARRQMPTHIDNSIRQQASCPIKPIALFAEPAGQPIGLLAGNNNRGCVKILREFEPGKSRSSTGRLVISGRMVDVCAALDRMAT